MVSALLLRNVGFPFKEIPDVVVNEVDDPVFGKCKRVPNWMSPLNKDIPLATFKARFVVAPDGAPATYTVDAVPVVDPDVVGVSK